MADLNKVSIVISAIDRTRGFSDLQRNFASLQKQAEGVSTAGMYLAGVVGTSLVASLAAAGAASIKNADEMGKMAQKAGMAVDEFSLLSFSAKQADVSQQSLIAASKKLSDEMVKAGRGSESVLAQFLAQADVFAKMKDGAEKTTLAVQLFGKSGQDLIPLLNQGSDAIRRQMEQADKLGLKVGADFASQADEFGDNIELMKSSLMGLSNTLAQTVLPGMVKLQRYLVDTEVNLKAAHTACDDLTAAFVFLHELGKAPSSNKLPFPFNLLLDDTKISQVIKDIKEAGSKTVEGLAGESDAEIDISKDGPTPLPGSGMSDNARQYRDAIDEMVRTNQVFRLDQLDGYEKEKERLGQELQARIDNISARSLLDQEFIEDSTAAWEAYKVKLGQLDEQQAKQRLQTQQKIVTGMSEMFGNLATAAKAFGKKGFDAWKAFATAQAIIDTYGAANKAYHAMAGIPYIGPALGIAAAAAAIAAGMANVHAIQSTQAAHGGLDFVPSESTFLLQRGERVVQPEQNTRLTAFLDEWEGGGGRQQSAPIHVYMDGQRLFDVLFDGTRDGRIQIHPRAISDTRN